MKITKLDWEHGKLYTDNNGDIWRIHGNSLIHNTTEVDIVDEYPLRTVTKLRFKPTTKAIENNLSVEMKIAIAILDFAIVKYGIQSDKISEGKKMLIAYDHLIDNLEEEDISMFEFIDDAVFLAFPDENIDVDKVCNIISETIRQVEIVEDKRGLK